MNGRNRRSGWSGRVWRFLAVAAIGAMLGAGGAALAQEEAAAVEDTAVQGQARDPVCGMTIDVEGAAESVYRNTRFYFCSEDCQQKFDAAPADATTGLAGENCVCSAGEMQNCKCGHCTGKDERCPCGDPKHDEGGEAEGGHDHGGHDHSGHAH